MFLSPYFKTFINWEKLTSRPPVTKANLGLVINSRGMTVRVEQDKCSKVKDACFQARATKIVLIIQIASLIGVMVSYTPAKSRALGYNAFNFEEKIKLTHEALEDS